MLVINLVLLFLVSLGSCSDLENTTCLDRDIDSTLIQIARLHKSIVTDLDKKIDANDNGIDELKDLVASLKSDLTKSMNEKLAEANRKIEAQNNEIKTLNSEMKTQKYEIESLKTGATAVKTQLTAAQAEIMIDAKSPSRPLLAEEDDPGHEQPKRKA